MTRNTEIMLSGFHYCRRYT